MFEDISVYTNFLQQVILLSPEKIISVYHQYENDLPEGFWGDIIYLLYGEISPDANLDSFQDYIISGQVSNIII